MPDPIAPEETTLPVPAGLRLAHFIEGPTDIRHDSSGRHVLRVADPRDLPGVLDSLRGVDWDRPVGAIASDEGAADVLWAVSEVLARVEAERARGAA